MKRKDFMRILVVTALILSVPLIAMQFSDEVDWKLADFILIGGLIIGTGLMYELVAKKISGGKHRVVLGAGLLIALILVWMELAVGIFGSPFAGS